MDKKFIIEMTCAKCLTKREFGEFIARHWRCIYAPSCKKDKLVDYIDICDKCIDKIGPQIDKLVRDFIEGE